MDNENNKLSEIDKEKYGRYLRIGVIAALVIVFCWAMFSDISDNRRTINDIGKQLNTVGEEQRDAQKQIESIQSGLSDSQQQLGRIEQSNSDAQATAGRIESTNNSIKESINDASEQSEQCADIVRDSEQRIAGINQLLQEVRRQPEKTNNSN